MGSELRGGSTHEYRLELNSGWYVRLQISQPGIDVAAALYDSAGEIVAGTSGPSGIGEDETISLVTTRNGGYRLIIVPQDPQAIPGHYKVLLQDLRPARPSDDQRVAAERTVEEGRRYGSLPSTRPLAIQKLSGALALWRVLGDVRREVDTLNLLGPVYRQEGRTAEAIGAYQDAGMRARRAGYHRGEALSLNNLGFALHRENEYDKAVAMYRHSLALWTRVGDLSEQCFVLQNLGQLHLDAGKLHDALAFYRDALAIAPTDSDRAKALGSIGVIKSRLGDLDGALSNLLRARKLNTTAGDKSTGALIAATIGSIHFQRRQFQEAIAAFDEALGLNPDPGTRAVILQNQAPIFLDLGDLDRALASYQKAAELFIGLGNREWEDYCRIGIGWVRQLQGDPRSALAEYERIEAQGLTYERALAYWALGQPARAAKLLENGLPRAQEEDDLTREGEIRLALGAAYKDMNRTREAQESLNRAVALGRRVEAPGIVAPGLFRSAQIERDEGRLEEARVLAEEALSIIESLRSRIAGRELGTSFFASGRAYYELYIALLLRLDDLHPRRGYREEALATSERARARVLLDLLNEVRLARDSTSRQGGRVAEPRPTPGAFPRMRLPTPPGLDQIRSFLDEETALLEYVLSKEGSSLFVVTRERLEVFPLPDVAEIDRQVLLLRESLLSKEVQSLIPTYNDVAYTEVAHRLYEKLIAPAARVLAGKRRLIIAPDRSLYLLPFEALLTAPAAGVSFQRMPFLLSRYTISYVPSASVLSTLRQTRRQPALQRFVAFADPVPSPVSIAASRSSRGLAPLPAAVWEVSKIAQFLKPGESSLYLGARATEESVKENPLVANARYLHFATHGLLDEKHPERSGLILGRAPQDRQDGFLQAFEVFQLDLSADLVVLSACDTRGVQVTGEGLVGLSRAFLYAGAPSIQVSLWSVADVPSAYLMAGFYRELGWTDDKAGALRRAKLAMISGSSRYAHPYYWAPFILIGDPGRPL